MFTSFEGQSELIALEETLRCQQTQAWAFSFICLMSVLFTAAAATRIPLYLETGEVARLLAVVALGSLVFVCTLDNMRTHITLLTQRHRLTQQYPFEFEA